MRVKELIAKLQEQNPEALVITITIVSHNDWEYTSEPVIKKQAIPTAKKFGFSNFKPSKGGYTHWG